MNRSKILSTPGPVTGASKRASLVWIAIAVGIYLAMLYPMIAWTSWNVLLILLLAPFLGIVPAGIQANQNGSVALSFLLSFAPVFGTITGGYLHTGGVGVPGYFLVLGLFAGATAHLLGIGFSKPRDASVAETRLVTGILLVSGAAFVYIRFPGFHEVGVAAILVASATGILWLAREALY